MSQGNRGWNDKLENYLDSYTIRINGTTATAVLKASDYTQPVAVYGITIALNTSVGSGDVVLVDGSATADSGDNRNFIAVVASGAVPYNHTVQFTRGLTFNVGLIVSAATITGAVNVHYKPRYS